MLAEWLTPDDTAWFASQYLHKAPYARPGAARDVLPLFTWDTLDHVPASAAPLDLLTVATDTALGERLDFTSVRAERSPMFSARLAAGDWLYLPPRWWHLVKCVEESLSISVGVMPPGELRGARRLPSGWTGGRNTAQG